MSKRILVVEDQEDNRRIVRDLLTRAGYEMIEAVNGEEGVAMAQTERPHMRAIWIDSERGRRGAGTSTCPEGSAAGTSTWLVKRV